MAMAVARRPNTGANFERATRFPHRALRFLRFLRLACSILIMGEQISSNSSVQKREGRMSRLPAHSKRQILLSKIRTDFGTLRKFWKVLRAQMVQRSSGRKEDSTAKSFSIRREICMATDTTRSASHCFRQGLAVTIRNNRVVRLHAKIAAVRRLHYSVRWRLSIAIPS